MRVGINARLLRAHSLRGWNRYTINLLTELPAFGVELYLYTDSALHPAQVGRLRPGSFVVRSSAPMRYLFWEQVWLPRRCAADRVDVLHTPFNFGLPCWSPCPRVLTLHDAIDHAETWSRQGRTAQLRPAALYNRLYHWFARRSADRVITVSEHSRRDLVSFLGISPEKITVIYEAADERFHRPVSPEVRKEIRRAHRLPRAYVFYVGGLEFRKNLPHLVRAFAAAKLEWVDLVIASVDDNSNQNALQSLANQVGVGGNVRFLGEVDDQDLPGLYAEALAFVYPSRYEGFGLQLCEAMAVGCPVLAARATSLPEVLGEGGDLFDLDDPADLAAKLVRIAQEPSIRNELSLRARRRARAFSWRRAAAETYAVYSSCLRGRQDTPELR